MPDSPPPYQLCAICLVLLGKHACPAITTISGDAICGDHVLLRINYVSLGSAIRVAEADLDRPDRPPVSLVRPLIEALTEREETVLRYLASNLTMPQIGRELFVSVNTVKTHQRSIYRKLDVNGRREALWRARQLGLLGVGGSRLTDLADERAEHPGG